MLTNPCPQRPHLRTCQSMFSARLVAKGVLTPPQIGHGPLVPQVATVVSTTHSSFCIAIPESVTMWILNSNQPLFYQVIGVVLAGSANRYRHYGARAARRLRNASELRLSAAQVRAFCPMH